MADNNSEGYFGSKRANDSTSEFNAMQFIVLQTLAAYSHAMPVKVVAVTNNGELSPVGLVDVQPMVNQLDGQGNAVRHGTINQIPYMRMQGGANAVILDPKVGDIGIAVFADRDISAVKANKDIANPGSMRWFDMADGMYIGGILNAAPEQYVQFSSAGIKLFSPTAIKLESSAKVEIVAPEVTIDATTSVEVTTPTFTVNGDSQFNGTVDASGNISAPDGVFGGKSFNSHKHGGVQTGGGQTGTPV